MAGLPGWDRDRLAAAPGADVEAARWQIYAGKVEPQINTDYAGLIHKLEVGEMSAKAREHEQKAQDRRDKETFRAGERRQADLRKGLLLDEEDEPDEDDD
jgi:hypothetical protein